MIYESKYWKDDLLRKADTLEKRKIQKRWVESSFARLEQDLMTGFYSIRKLVDARKVADAFSERRVEIIAYPWTGKPVTFINRHDFWELYRLDEPTPKMRTLGFLCNQIIHSFVYVINFDEDDKFSGISFSSDSEKNKWLYSIEIDRVIRIFRSIGSNYPNKLVYERNSDSGDFIVHTYS